MVYSHGDAGQQVEHILYYGIAHNALISKMGNHASSNVMQYPPGFLQPWMNNSILQFYVYSSFQNHRSSSLEASK